MSTKEDANTIFVAPLFHPIPISRWWSKETVAIVTGANKGIGFSLVRQLAELGLTVVLTAIDHGRGLAVVELLKNEGLLVHFCRLDISDQNSIHDFVAWFQHAFGVVDILKLKNPKLKAILLDEENLLESQLDGMINLFLEDVKNGTWKSNGDGLKFGLTMQFQNWLLIG
ncbi:hypothetical protein SASPL_104934 [Salvia splendens]|uniref:(+)-neomenthol dehydrogenase n=1 Tax=Salvia splendens TaxID=180675 RepID=A0A8X8YNP3_SALSN|nr:(+)-neomenthol dehydrogenase-like [Salvia splendens]KAG6433325.1 hypothetical protein SASPL_104934 [Salvia splendens]